MSVVGWRAARTLALGLVGLAAACTSQPTEPAVPLELVIGSGDGQFAVVGSQIPSPLRVVVRAASTSLPREDVTVLWDVTQGGAALVGAATTVTDESGSTQLFVRLGASPGAVRVRARVADQPEVSVEFALFGVLQPTLTSISPATAAAGATVTVTGTSFSPVPEQNVVLFSGVRGRVVSASSTSLQVIVPRCLPAREVAVRTQLGVVASTETLSLLVTGGISLEAMAVGDAIDVADDAGFECHALPGEAGRSYLAVVYSASTVGAAKHPYRFTALTSPSLVATPARADAPVPEAALAPATDPQADWDRHLRELEGALVRQRAAPGHTAPAPAVSGPAMVPAAGERRTFNVLNAQGTFEQVGAVAQWVSSQAAIFVDTLAPAGGFNVGELASFASRFDQVIHPQVTSTFGAASDLDSNGRVIVLFTPVVNRLTARGAAGFVGGFFFGVDLLPSRTGSNVGEIFYALVPDPTGVHSSPRSKSLVANTVPAILAHEFQHMVHFNERVLAREASGQEALWLAEGLAQMAEEVVARAYQWLGDSASDTLFRSGIRARARQYLLRPDTVSLIVTTGQGSLPERGAGFLSVLYLEDRFGGGILARLTRTTRTGFANVEAESGLEWEDFVEDWWSALYLDGLLAGTPPRAYPTVDLRGFLGGSFPLSPVLVGSSGLDASGALWSSSAAYYMVNTVAGASVSLRLGGEAGGPSAPQSLLRMRIIRVS